MASTRGEWLLKEVISIPEVPVQSWWGAVYSNQGPDDEVTCGNSGFPTYEWEWVTDDEGNTDCSQSVADSAIPSKARSGCHIS